MPSLRLMVVHADDYAAMLTGAALCRLGHRVEKFASAKVALQALREAPGAYDAIVASAALDSMTGLEFARAAQLADARLRLLRWAGHRAMGIGNGDNVLVLPREHLFANPIAVQSLWRAAEHSARLAA